MKKIAGFIKNHKKHLSITIGVLIVAGLLGRRIFAQQGNKPVYQTAQAERGTLISAISASGTVSAGSSNDISTKAGGIVKEVFVKNGETVKKGQKIALLILDDESQARSTIAWSAYIDAVNAEKTAEANKITSDIKMWQDRQAIFNSLDDQDYKNNNSINPETKEKYTDSEKTIIDKTVEQKRKIYEASETAYKNADAQVNKAKAQVATAWRNYQETSAAITAPVDGVVSNFSLAPGVTIIASVNESSSTSGGSVSVSSQKLGSIINSASQYQATVNLSEIDVVKINPDQKVTLTLDAYPEMTFTGKVLSIDTSGRVNSGVTNYPAIILFDQTLTKIYPNMAVTAKILINVKDSVILVPSSAVQGVGNMATVRVMKNGEIDTIPVEIGDSNDTRTEIISGIGEGDEVVVNVVAPNSGTGRSQSQGTSVFGNFGGRGNMGGGAARMMVR